MAITQEQANQIIQAYQSGVDPQTLAAQYGLTQRDVDTYFPGFDTTGLNLPSGAPAPIATSFTQQSGSRLTPGQAQQLYNAYQQGDMTNLQKLVNQFGVTANDVQAYFPGFDMANASGINLAGKPTTFNLNDYNAQTQDNPYLQAARATSEGNLQGAQTATVANRVNQTTPFGNLQYTQTGVDAQGNPIWSASQTLAPEFQGSLSNLAGQVAQNTAQGFNPNLPSVGINPGETYSDAIMRRLQPQQQQAAQRLEAQLANQGIMPGSEAYDRAKTQLAQQQNDQLTSAIVGGFNTGLAANQQQFAQEAAKYQLPLNQLSAFRQATAPNYVAPSQQQTTAGPDYLTSYNLQQQNAIAQQAAEQAGQNAVTGGLFGLGSSLLGSKAGGNLIEKGIGAVGGLLGGLF